MNDGEHNLWVCEKLKKQTPAERFDLVNKLKCCFCCFNTHLFRDCKSERRCGKIGCTKKHKRLLHAEATQKQKHRKGETKTNVIQTQSWIQVAVEFFVSSQIQGNPQVNTKAPCRTGSTVSLIGKNSKSDLKLSREATSMTIADIHGTWE